jgi:hypothetical protein
MEKSMIKFLKKIFGQSRKAKPVVPPIWPYNVKTKKVRTKKAKIEGQWEMPQ